MPPPQIKQDLNRSGWESTDFPSVCENCLPENPYVKMLKEDYGAECKLCERPFTVFSWATDRAHGRKKKTNICLTCARLKNACQTCIMDLQFGLPIVVRDKALQMAAAGPSSDVNKEYFAQNNERAIEDGNHKSLEQYGTAEEKGRELLRRLANSKPYFRKGWEVDEQGNRIGGRPSGGGGGAGPGNAVVGAGVAGPGPIRTRDSRAAVAVGAGPGRRKGVFPSTSQLPPGPKDYLPPADKSIMSLFVTGVEDDLPEHKIRDFFKEHGKIKSLVCSHMSHCAFVNYETREAAETAAAACQGSAVIAGCPLRVRWGQPKPIGTMSKEERLEMLRDGRSAFPARRGGGRQAVQSERDSSAAEAGSTGLTDNVGDLTVAPPPGTTDVQYASLAGN